MDSASPAVYLSSTITKVPPRGLARNSRQSLSPLRRVDAGHKRGRRTKSIEFYWSNVTPKYNQASISTLPVLSPNIVTPNIKNKKKPSPASSWQTNHLMEDAIRENLSAAERRYISSHLAPLNGMRRCSKNHIICSRYKPDNYETHPSCVCGVANAQLHDSAKAYVEHYQSEPVLLQYGEDGRRRIEKRLMSLAEEPSPYMSLSYSITKVRDACIKRASKAWH